MTEYSTSSPSDALGDDLPPVEPPSAGFIVQLFVVPAVIVLAVVAVWALFGSIAAGEQDWHRLVQDLDSANPHVSKRAMFGLATLLDNDQRLRDAGQHLSTNAQIASAMSRQLEKSLQAPANNDEALALQVYLARALGLMDVPDAVVPALAKAMSEERDVEVRKGAVLSLALVAGRALDRGHPLGEDAVAALVSMSEDKDPALRRPAAFALGLIPSVEAADRLHVLLEDADRMTAVNAAVALARQKSPDGFPVFVSALSKPEDAAEPQDTILIQKNVLKAVAEVGSKFNLKERDQLRQAITPLTNHAEPRIRIEAQGALTAIAVR